MASSAQAPTRPASGSPNGSGAPQPPVVQQPDPLTAQVRQQIEEAMLHGCQAAMMVTTAPDDYKAWMAGILSGAQALAGGQRPVGGK